MFFKNEIYWSILVPAIGISALVVGGALFTPCVSQSTSGMETSKIGTAFEKAPRLSPIFAIHTEAGGSSTYTFTVKVSKDAGQSLQAVRVTQLDGIKSISFRNNQSRAYLGDRVAEGQSIPLVSVGGEQESGVLIPFEKPIAPGQSVTITLQVERNPSEGGIYQFGVTAYPVGDNSAGLYLGTERVNYESR